MTIVHGGLASNGRGRIGRRSLGFVAAMLVVTLVAGGLVAWTLVAMLRPAAGPSLLARIPEHVPFHDGVYCVESERYCLVEAPGGEVVALSTGVDRGLGRTCYVRWMSPPPEGLADRVPAGDTGLFREGCWGSTFTRLGVRVFGPAAHGLDRFPIVEQGGTRYVDRSHVEPGTPLP